MTIIISKNNKDAKKIQKSTIEKEEYLQKYIQDNPESIPIYEIEENKRLLVISREFPTNSGPLDALAIDQSGDIYVVETKLYKNPDKRKVVAQVLDYGASLWKHSYSFEDLESIVDKELKVKFNLTLKEKTKEFFGLDDEELDLLFTDMISNLENGNFKFVVLMDHLDDRLKDLVQYVNENSKFDIYPVELEFYKFEQYEIMIPRLFGAEIKKNLNVVKSSGQRTQWTEETLLEKMKENPEKDYRRHLKLYEFLKKNSDRIKFGTGNLNASYTPIVKKISKTMFPISIYTNGKVLVKLNWTNFKEIFGDERIDSFAEELLKELNDKKRNTITKETILDGEVDLHIDDLKNRFESLKRFYIFIKEY